MRRKSAGGRPRPLRVLRGGKANCSRFHCSSVRSVGYKVVFCILPYSKTPLDIRCPRTQKDQKMIFQTRSYKLALYLIAADRLKIAAPHRDEVVARLRAMQSSDGGCITDYKDDK